MTDQTGIENTSGAEGMVDNQDQTGGGDQSKSTETETRTVPLSVLQTVESKLKDSETRLKELEKEAGEAKTLREQLELYQAQSHVSPYQTPGQTSTPEQKPTVPEFEIDDEDVVTGKELKEIVTKLAGSMSGNNPALEQKLAKLELSIQDPDYENTIKTYLPSVINKNPAIANLIRNAGSQNNALNVALALATVAKKQAQEMESAATNNNETGQSGDQPTFMDQLNAIITNSEKVKSPGITQTGAAALSGASRFANMSKEEFAAHKAKVLAGTL